MEEASPFKKSELLILALISQDLLVFLLITDVRTDLKKPLTPTSKDFFNMSITLSSSPEVIRLPSPKLNQEFSMILPRYI